MKTTDSPTDRDRSNDRDCVEYPPVVCPFTVIVDSREGLPYTFDNLYDGPAGRSHRLAVPIRRDALTVGDYSVFGWPRIVIERKSKQDLYGSISQARENFVGRLERMSDATAYDWAAVIVEAEWSEILSQPPPFTQYAPKSLARTIQAWMIRFPAVHWIFMPNRDFAEAMTFRLLERYWKDRQSEMIAESHESQSGMTAESGETPESGEIPDP